LTINEPIIYQPDKRLRKSFMIKKFRGWVTQ